MKLKDIIADENVTIYELNKSIIAPTMYGALLYRGNAILLHGQILERDVFKLLTCCNPTHIIVY
jgi:hypothetical protein